MEITWEAILSVATAVATIGGAYITVLKIQKSRKEAKEAERQAILDEVNQILALKEQEFKAQVEEVSSRVDGLEASVKKDLDHIRETYNGEIRNLGEKIENLRTELRNQHGSLVQLLSKLIDNTKN